MVQLSVLSGVVARLSAAGGTSEYEERGEGTAEHRLSKQPAAFAAVDVTEDPAIDAAGSTEGAPA